MGRAAKIFRSLLRIFFEKRVEIDGPALADLPELDGLDGARPNVEPDDRFRNGGERLR